MIELNKEKKRIKRLGAGNFILVLFLILCVVSIYYAYTSLIVNDIKWMSFTFTAIGIILSLAAVFWIGIYLVYRNSVQLGIKWRAIGAIFGMIPIAHLITLGIILKICIGEYYFEKKKIRLNEARLDSKICATKYPILMVHGVFFRDFRYLNYWGRIPGQLELNGAKIFYGNQQSAESVESCGQELAERIKEICAKTGCDKVNIIAHSKGGLDSRYALTIGNTAEHVASLTTINTPHRGCEFADYLLSKIGTSQQQAVAKGYNSILHKLGDHQPDFLAAVYDLTASSCAAFNKKCKNVEGVLYQSYGSKMNVARGGRFPLNFSTHLVKYFDGSNDGLVGEKSFPWGENYKMLTVKGNRGISHGDMIDLNRENLPEFDVREFYVQLVADLKNKGY
ncbi:esterase/lipase family protein [Pseudobutyrivibrio sp. MD2005]|uniref:esterase/lipase family protein n=1 Tax=Pseudobutyrivibrio sp. MD2005 TaxID=1410616 RepID=UPI000686FEE2|nr:triacylglycerol lipase [Pseudobutyrivibrio sp. MD2005]